MHAVTDVCVCVCVCVWVYKMSANMNFQQYSRFSKFVILIVQGFRPFIITDFNIIVSTSCDCFGAEFVLYYITLHNITSQHITLH